MLKLITGNTKAVMSTSGIPKENLLFNCIQFVLILLLFNINLLICLVAYASKYKLQTNYFFSILYGVLESYHSIFFPYYKRLFNMLLYFYNFYFIKKPCLSSQENMDGSPHSMNIGHYILSVHLKTSQE